MKEGCQSSAKDLELIIHLGASSSFFQMNTTYTCTTRMQKPFLNKANGHSAMAASEFKNLCRWRNICFVKTPPGHHHALLECPIRIKKVGSHCENQSRCSFFILRHGWIGKVM